ncbi:DinB family protein [Tepidiforma sp.]|uniref:DinB family protein n=1 Tax=Tepidiforma sp. TaxID=2682230 RepID=UPI002ADD3273|nr:DinB family protein [Tepidiforma sp.]
MSDDDARSQADERRRLLAELELERNQLLRNIETCRIRDIERPFIGEWSLKDIVGHVATWEAEVVTALREISEGRRPRLYDFDRGRLDEWNQEHVERKRSLDFWSVLGQLRDGRQRLLEAIARFPDDLLADETSPVRRLVHSVIDHDREHWHGIAARLAGMEGARRTGAQSIIEEATS